MSIKHPSTDYIILDDTDLSGDTYFTMQSKIISFSESGIILAKW